MAKYVWLTTLENGDQIYFKTCDKMAKYYDTKVGVIYPLIVQGRTSSICRWNKLERVVWDKSLGEIKFDVEDEYNSLCKIVHNSTISEKDSD